MKRFVRRNPPGSGGNFEEGPANVDAFIAEISAVCKSHGLYISHEDSEGSFIITPNEGDEMLDWLNNASVDLTQR